MIGAGLVEPHDVAPKPPVARMAFKDFVRLMGRRPTPLERLVNGWPLRAP